MKASLFSFILTITLSFNSIAQNGTNQIGARSASMGHASSTLEDHWAVFNNPGALGGLEETSAFAAFENRFGIAGLNSMAAGFVTSLSLGSAGLSVFRFGDQLYNEQMVSVVYGNMFGISSLGARVNYLQYSVEGFGTKGVITIDFGGTATLTENLRFGAFIRNINQARISEINNQRTPTILLAGVSYTFSNRLLLAIETEKDIDMPALFKAGIEYQFLPKFYARTGIKTNQLVNYFGLGFVNQNLEIDYALTWESTLGVNHQANVSYIIKK